MVPTQKKAAEQLVALATKKAVLRDAAAFIVGAKKAAAAKLTPGGLKGGPSQPASKAPAGEGAKGRKAAAKIAADFIKASCDLHTSRKAALIKAAAHYQLARKSDNREHVKKATVHLAKVLSLIEMEKQAVAGKAGSWIMKLIQKLGERTAGLGAKGVGGLAKKLSTKGLGGFAPGKLGVREAVQTPMAGTGWLAALKARLGQIAGGTSPRLAAGLGAGTAGAGGLGLAGLGSALGGGPAQD